MMTKSEHDKQASDLFESISPDSPMIGARLSTIHKNYIHSLEAENARLEKLFACAYEALAELIVCPHEVYGFKSTKHNCNECDSVNAETCFCWADWIEDKIAKDM